MSVPSVAHFFFDYVDPASFLVERHISALEPTLDVMVERAPYELRLPPSPLIDPTYEPWRARWSAAHAAARALEVPLTAPRLIPWTRKAHELAFQAREENRFDGVHLVLFDAFHLHGRDLGRVDVLLELAVKCGMDLTHTKAVLDVDRHTGAIERARAEAERLGVPGVPALLAHGRNLIGLQERGTILSFLQATQD